MEGQFEKSKGMKKMEAVCRVKETVGRSGWSTGEKAEASGWRP